MTVNFMKRNKDNKAVVVKITPTKLNPPSLLKMSMPGKQPAWQFKFIYDILTPCIAPFSVSNIQIHNDVTFVMEHSNKWKKTHKKYFWKFQHVRKKYLPPACFGESISRSLHPLTLILSHPNPSCSLQNYLTTHFSPFPSPTPQPPHPSLLLAKLPTSHSESESLGSTGRYPPVPGPGVNSSFMY